MSTHPKDSENSNIIVSRRALILGGVQLSFMGVLGLRMRFMQVEQADQFRLLAEENRVNIRLLPPARGLIFDRFGDPIAENEQNYRIVMVREDVDNIEATIARLARLVELEPEDLDRATKELKRQSAFVPVTVADRLNWDDFAEIAVNTPALPGVTTEVGLSRRYPQKADFAHVIGYVGPVSEYDLDDLDDPEPLLQIPKFQIGKVGVETKLESVLRGSAGTLRIEVNAVGRVMRELERKPGTPGKDLQLTVDAMLQNFVQARIGDESAAAVVIDTTNGDLLAIGSSPSFDPNKFVRGISVTDYSELTQNEYRPLANKSVQGAYPPGSTFKMIVALAALKADVFDPEEKVFCPGYKQLGNRRFHCWKRGGHGKVKLVEAIYQSCDVFFYEIAERVGIDKISEMARQLGLGVRHDIPMSAINAGIAPNKAWKKEWASKYEDQTATWRVGDTLNAGIGQGFVLASPLQLAIMSARIASGNNIIPRLIKTIDGVETFFEKPASLGIDPEHLRLVREGMISVSNKQRGTAYRARILDDDKQLAGKTGTSQVRNISKAERASGVIKNRDLPWKRRDHALFVAYAPHVAPKIAVSVVVEHGGGGSTVAAPIARDIVLQALYGGLPPLTAYPSNQRKKIQEIQNSLVLRDPAKAPTGRLKT